MHNKALELLDKVLEQSSACLRVMMARGDCLAHLGRSAKFNMSLILILFVLVLVVLVSTKQPLDITLSVCPFALYLAKRTLFTAIRC